MNEKIDMRDAFFNSLYEIISKDKNVIVLTADHGAFGLDQIRKDFPEQYINVGIAEQNMISVAAGLALSGKIVYVYSIINFVTLRCLEQINIDISGMNLHVNIIGVGAGFTYSTDGPTHHGIQDIAIMSAIPNLKIYNCSDPINSRAFAKIAYEQTGPKYIRIEKGNAPTHYDEQHDFSSSMYKLKDGSKVIIISTGLIINKAIEIAKSLEKDNISIGVIDVYLLNPMDAHELLKFVKSSRLIITMEDNISSGGLSSKVHETISLNDIKVPIKSFSLNKKHHYYYSMNRGDIEDRHGLSQDEITKFIRDWDNEN